MLVSFLTLMISAGAESAASSVRSKSNETLLLTESMHLCVCPDGKMIRRRRKKRRRRQRSGGGKMIRKQRKEKEETEEQNQMRQRDEVSSAPTLPSIRLHCDERPGPVVTGTAETQTATIARN